MKVFLSHPPPPPPSLTSCCFLQVSVAGYMDFVRVSRPNVFESLCDSVSSHTNKLKRVRKSVDRTLRFLDEALALKQECQVFPSRHLHLKN